MKLKSSKSSLHLNVALLTHVRTIDSPKEKPSLLTIPLEIRNQIFGELFKNVLVEATHREIITRTSWQTTARSTQPFYLAHHLGLSDPFVMGATEGTCAAARGKANRFPRLGHRIVMTCFQLYREAYLLPWQNCTFYFDDPFDFVAFFKHTTKEHRGAIRSVHLCIRYDYSANLIKQWANALKPDRVTQFNSLRHLTIHLSKMRNVRWVRCLFDRQARTSLLDESKMPPFPLPPLQTATVRADFPLDGIPALNEWNRETARAFEVVFEKILLQQVLHKDLAREAAGALRGFEIMVTIANDSTAWNVASARAR